MKNLLQSDTKLADTQVIMAQPMETTAYIDDDV